MWLDFANQDVKTLFQEREYLRWLSDLAFVEIGQRRKHLVWKEGAPKLVDPELHAWFETYAGGGLAIPLYGPVGGFSQAGFAANRALVNSVMRAVQASGVNHWVELFCGNGNFTLAMASRGLQVEAVEMDPLAIEGLEMSLKTTGLQVKLARADVYLKAKTLPDLQGRGLLVDPPRSGLKQLLEVLEAGSKPRSLVYVSCFNQSFLSDLERLRAMGARIESIEGVDQFPHSAHAEWVARLSF